MGGINHQKYGWLIIVLPTLVIYVVYVCSPRQNQEEELRADELRAAGLLSTGEDVSPEERKGLGSSHWQMSSDENMGNMGCIIKQYGFVWKCWVNIPSEIAIFLGDNDQQNHWVQWGTLFSDTPIWDVQHGKHGNASSNREIFPWPRIFFRQDWDFGPLNDSEILKFQRVLDDRSWWGCLLGNEKDLPWRSKCGGAAWGTWLLYGLPM